MLADDPRNKRAKPRLLYSIVPRDAKANWFRLDDCKSLLQLLQMYEASLRTLV